MEMDIESKKNAHRSSRHKKEKKQKDKKRKSAKHKHKRTKKTKRDTTLNTSSSENSSSEEIPSLEAFGDGSSVDFEKDKRNLESGSLCLERDDWMTSNSLFLNTYSKSKKIQDDKSKLDVYDPEKNPRELNPYWKAGNRNGLPFQKPIDEDFNLDYSLDVKRHQHKNHKWKKNQMKMTTDKEKQSEDKSIELPKTQDKSLDNYPEKYLNDDEMNALGAKIIKAEIMGNVELATTLKKQLDNSRQLRNRSKDAIEKSVKEKSVMNDPSKQQYVKTKRNQSFNSHYRENNDFSILNKFQPEKQITQKQLELEYDEFTVEHSSKTTTDLFENSKGKKLPKTGSQTEERTNNIYENFNKGVMYCDRCLESNKMDKELMVAMGSNCYLTLPWHEGLQPGHCLIVPVQHVSCSTELDEDVWLEITNFRKSITKMFYERKMSVVFFELAKYTNQRSHMVIHCVASKNLDLAPFYFKKAIEESENEWSTNKQLISLKDKNLIKSIPKGLPYFWVHFGMENGFAHVIENQEKFPINFAQEIIGNILNLSPQKWRKPRKEYNSTQNVKQLASWWKHYDCTQDKTNN